MRTSGALRCRRKFLRFFPLGFYDPKYIDWERGYKEAAHNQWVTSLGKREYRALLEAERYDEIARLAAKIEGKTNLLFSFEKMALRDALRTDDGARVFAEGLFESLHGTGGARKRFETWIETVESLPRKQTRVLTWPLVTVFGFIAQPEKHIFLKPNVTRIAADEYEYGFEYRSRPNWETYASLLKFAETIRGDLTDLEPRDMIDLQSFMWVQGSGEYEE
jgi:hypothetical protein